MQKSTWGDAVTMRCIRNLASAILISIFALYPAVSWAGPASELVQNFQSGLLSVMKDAKKLGVKGRYDRLEPIITNTFHLPLMAGLSAGTHWQTASRDQRNRLVEAFTGMSIATLATLFDGYSGEEFIVQGEREGPQGITFVDTALKIPGRDSDVAISYVARKSEGQWRLIDVIVDGGISELKVRISEYRQTLNQGGIEGLINLLRNKVSDLLS